MVLSRGFAFAKSPGTVLLRTVLAQKFGDFWLIVKVKLSSLTLRLRIEVRTEPKFNFLALTWYCQEGYPNFLCLQLCSLIHFILNQKEGIGVKSGKIQVRREVQLVVYQHLFLSFDKCLWSC